MGKADEEEGAPRLRDEGGHKWASEGCESGSGIKITNESPCYRLITFRR